jgi:hypothetical protein
MNLLLAILLASGPPSGSFLYTASGGLFTAGRSPHAHLLLQAGVRNDVAELRQYLGMGYRAVIQALDAKNQILLRNTEPLAPAQAAEMRLRMQAPARLAADQPLLSARITNVGQGLLSFLFEDDFLTEQVNFVFCPAEADNPARPERVMTIQVLLDDRRALAPAVTLLQTVYQMPQPLRPGAEYMPVLMYPLAPNLPATIWSFGTLEAVYQPVLGNALITGQLWLTDKTVVMQCANVPKL